MRWLWKGIGENVQHMQNHTTINTKPHFVRNHSSEDVDDEDLTGFSISSDHRHAHQGEGELQVVKVAIQDTKTWVQRKINSFLHHYCSETVRVEQKAGFERKK